MRYLLVLAIACGSSPAPAPTRSDPAVVVESQPASSGDVQVATVNGRPVWGSCVVAQAARGVARDEALRQCIDFELMAQEAEARGFVDDPDVALATRTAVVSELVASEFEDKLTTPADFGAFWTRNIERNRMRLEHPEARGSVYARIPLARNAPADEDAKARALAEELHAALADERGLMRPHLAEIAERVVAGRAPVEVAPVGPAVRAGRLHKAYASALFEIPEIGRTSPPVRTPWGWDIILWESVIPAKQPTPEQMVAEALPEIKRSYFTHWVNRIAKNLGINIEVLEKNLPLLEQL